MLQYQQEIHTMNKSNWMFQKQVMYAMLLTIAFCLFFVPNLAADSINSDSSIEHFNDTLLQNDSIDSDISIGVASTDKPESLYPMSAERKEKLISYSRFTNIWRFVSFFIGLGILAIILFTRISAKLRDFATRIKLRFFAVWLFFALFTIVDYLFNLPFSIYRGFMVENNYGFLNQTFTQWWGEDLLGLLIGIVVGIIPVWFFYSLVSKMKRWWLAFSLGAIPFAVLLIIIVPVFVSPLFNKF